MFKRQPVLKKNDYTVAWGNGSGLLLRISGSSDCLNVESIDDNSRSKISTNHILLLAPEDYSFGMVNTPEAVAQEDLQNALKWSYAKDDPDLDLEGCSIQTIDIPGGEGFSLIRSSHWVFAVEQKKLKSFIIYHENKKRKIMCVDVLALAQRNLGWAIAEKDLSVGVVATIVIGEKYSSIGVVDREGYLLFHKQFDASDASIKSANGYEKILLELQRNLGYFERRVSNVGISVGYVFGLGAKNISEYLNNNLGGFEWKEGVFPFVNTSKLSGEINGEQSWLIGALLRCRHE